MMILKEQTKINIGEESGKKMEKRNTYAMLVKM
jgi:hypothetical protein